MTGTASDVHPDPNPTHSLPGMSAAFAPLESKYGAPTDGCWACPPRTSSLARPWTAPHYSETHRDLTGSGYHVGRLEPNDVSISFLEMCGHAFLGSLAIGSRGKRSHHFRLRVP